MSVADADAPNPAHVRYHGLDALRAWAMSMGIVIHAAWIMIPSEAGAPMTDASASSFTDYICLAIHTFRMQLFFVLAGLFACLLLRKRGLKKFTGNRVQRIVLPLCVFWLILCPIMMWQYNSAGLATGAIQSDQSAWELTRTYLSGVGPGSILLLHLWFLYYLCWAYVAVFAVRGVAAIVDRDRKARDWIADKFGLILTSRWSVVILAALFAPFLFPMKGCWGIEIEFASLYAYRKLPGLLMYTSFFVVGWLMFRNIDQLGAMIRGWRWQLALGLLLTVPYFFYANYVSKNGYTSSNYPLLVVEDFHYNDGRRAYPELREKLLSAEEGSVSAALWQEIPELNQKFIREHSTANDNQLNGLCNAINLGILGASTMTEHVELDSIELSDQCQAIAQTAAADRTPEQNQQLNRELLEAELPGILYSEDVNRSYYYPIRAGYSFGYCLITWLLTFGCIGFSQNFFDSESRFWRYFSDSSYWFYLAHLPIQFQLLLWVGEEPWHWSLKFTFYVVATIGVLLPSYHFLVRPTWIGWFLNGRMTSVWSRKASQNDDDNDAPSSGDVRIDAGTPLQSPPHDEASETPRRELVT